MARDTSLPVTRPPFLQFVSDVGHERRRFLRTESSRTKMIKDEHVTIDLGFLFQIQATGIGLQVHHWPIWLGEAEDHERAEHRRVRTGAVRQYLQGDVRLLTRFEQPSELLAHHVGAADRAPQHYLLEHCPEPRPVPFA